MTEFEKMRSEEFYDFSSEECLASYLRAKHLCAKLQTMTVEDDDYRKTIEDLIPGIPESSTVSVKDIPSDSVAVGNPCRVIRQEQICL